MPTLSADWALLDDGWAPDALITHERGTMTSVATGRAPAHVTGALLPGMTNLHSHAFQRSFAGRTEFAGGGGDFWSWRQAMYAAAGAIEPDTLAPVAAYLGMELLRGGFTSLVEFHYLQNDRHGTPYAHRAAMAEAIIEGSRHAGIGLTLLFGIYQTGGFDGAPLAGGQVRFRTSPDDALAMLADAQPRTAPNLHFGLAPHSLRAVSPAALAATLNGLVTIDADAPVHIHVAEQRAEVAACLASLGAPPVAWLLDHADGRRLCLIHATHTTDGERARMAASGAVAGLCPSTEGNLGDGLFTLTDFIAAGGRFGIGTDSHVGLDAFAELRLLEYTQRLRTERRNVLAGAAGHTGRVLWQAAAHGGAQAAGRAVGRLRPGSRADLVVIDPAPEVAGMAPDFWLDAALFAAQRSPARDVMVGGEWVVRNHRHVRQDEIVAQYARALARMAEC